MEKKENGGDLGDTNPPPWLARNIKNCDEFMAKKKKKRKRGNKKPKKKNLSCVFVRVS
jgi:hypothetical protein